MKKNPVAKNLGKLLEIFSESKMSFTRLVMRFLFPSIHFKYAD